MVETKIFLSPVGWGSCECLIVERVLVRVQENFDRDVPKPVEGTLEVLIPVLNELAVEDVLLVLLELFLHLTLCAEGLLLLLLLQS